MWCNGKCPILRLRKSAIYVFGQAGTGEQQSNQQSVCAHCNFRRSAYYLLLWLIILFPEIRAPGRRRFNYALINCKMVTGEGGGVVFVRLKAKWYYLQNLLDASMTISYVLNSISVSNRTVIPFIPTSASLSEMLSHQGSVGCISQSHILHCSCTRSELEP